MDFWLNSRAHDASKGLGFLLLGGFRRIRGFGVDRIPGVEFHLYAEVCVAVSLEGEVWGHGRV